MTSHVWESHYNWQSLGISKIAVVSISGDYSDLASNYIEETLLQENIQVISRSALQSVRDELNLQQGLDFDVNSAKRLGKLLGVDAIIVGNSTTGNITKYEGQCFVALIQVRVIETETGRILIAKSSREEGDVGQDGVNVIKIACRGLFWDWVPKRVKATLF